MRTSTRVSMRDPLRMHATGSHATGANAASASGARVATCRLVGGVCRATPLLRGAPGGVVAQDLPPGRKGQAMLSGADQLGRSSEASALHVGSLRPPLEAPQLSCSHKMSQSLLLNETQSQTLAQRFERDIFRMQVGIVPLGFPKLERQTAAFDQWGFCQT